MKYYHDPNLTTKGFQINSCNDISGKRRGEGCMNVGGFPKPTLGQESLQHHKYIESPTLNNSSSKFNKDTQKTTSLYRNRIDRSAEVYFDHSSVRMTRKYTERTGTGTINKSHNTSPFRARNSGLYSFDADITLCKRNVTDQWYPYSTGASMNVDCKFKIPRTRSYPEQNLRTRNFFTQSYLFDGHFDVIGARNHLKFCDPLSNDVFIEHATRIPCIYGDSAERNNGRYSRNSLSGKITECPTTRHPIESVSIEVNNLPLGVFNDGIYQRRYVNYSTVPVRIETTRTSPLNGFASSPHNCNENITSIGKTKSKRYILHDSENGYNHLSNYIGHHSNLHPLEKNSSFADEKLHFERSGHTRSGCFNEYKPNYMNSIVVENESNQNTNKSIVSKPDEPETDIYRTFNDKCDNITSNSRIPSSQLVFQISETQRWSSPGRDVNNRVSVNQCKEFVDLITPKINTTRGSHRYISSHPYVSGPSNRIQGTQNVSALPTDSISKSPQQKALDSFEHSSDNGYHKAADHMVIPINDLYEHIRQKSCQLPRECREILSERATDVFILPKDGLYVDERKETTQFLVNKPKNGSLDWKNCSKDKSKGRTVFDRAKNDSGFAFLSASDNHNVSSTDHITETHHIDNYTLTKTPTETYRMLDRNCGTENYDSANYSCENEQNFDIEHPRPTDHNQFMVNIEKSNSQKLDSHFTDQNRFKYQPARLTDNIDSMIHNESYGSNPTHLSRHQSHPLIDGTANNIGSHRVSIGESPVIENRKALKPFADPFTHVEIGDGYNHSIHERNVDQSLIDHSRMLDKHQTFHSDNSVHDREIHKNYYNFDHSLVSARFPKQYESGSNFQSFNSTGAESMSGINGQALDQKPYFNMGYLYDSTTDQPIYVNAKQFEYIRKRKVRRDFLDSLMKENHKIGYLHESRHRHAMNRKRAPSGRFLTKAEMEAMKNQESGNSRNHN